MLFDPYTCLMLNIITCSTVHADSTYIFYYFTLHPVLQYHNNEKRTFLVVLLKKQTSILVNPGIYIKIQQFQLPSYCRCVFFSSLLDQGIGTYSYIAANNQQNNNSCKCADYYYCLVT